MKRTPKDLTGHRSGQLTILSPADPDYRGRPTWKCRCACGRTVVHLEWVLKKRRTKSCGCLAGGRDMVVTPSLAAKFWSVIGEDLDPTTCWLWPMSCTSRGYGTIYWKGRPLGAHRVAAAIRAGGVLEGRMEASHECDTPRCCNPAHIRPSSHRDNHAEGRERGRYASRKKGGSK